MQLTTIEQCSIGQKLYHAILGAGRVTNISKGKLYVWFDDDKGNHFGRIFEEVNKRQIVSIYNLYTEPVYICKKAVESRVFDGGGHLDRVIYEPVKTEK